MAAGSRPILWAHGTAVTLARFAADVRRLAARLPPAGNPINLCEDRGHFLLAYCAALARRQTSLLPPSRAAAVIAEVLAEYPGSYRCDDALVQSALGPAAPALTTGSPAASDARAASDPLATHALEFSPEQLAQIAFTSGSTGRPVPHRRLWGSFLKSTARHAARIRECLAPRYGDAVPWIVATVPPQHMFGTEMSVLLPLAGEMAAHSARPLFPADVAAALAEVPEPRILVSTPVHLRALSESGHSFAALALVMSATAPLEAALAIEVERALGAPLLEVFGSTETGGFATRMTAREQEWQPYPGVRLDPRGDGTQVLVPGFDGPVMLPDVLELRAGGRFIVSGRNTDVVEVAGKRASLAELTRRLLAIPGVLDAVVFQPDEARHGAVRRIAALVVAPGSTAEAIRTQLLASVDPALVPRPLLLVPALPRNELGKLSRERLNATLVAEADRAPGE